MTDQTNDPRDTQEDGAERPSYFPADQTPRREGGDDSLAEASPTDPRDDEKVLVNGQREPKARNTSSETAANTSRGSSTNEDNFDNA